MADLNLPEIYISNLMGLMLMIGVYLGNAWKMQKQNSEDKVLYGMIITVMLSCILDPIAYTVDGKPGKICFVLCYVCNMWSFVANLIIGPLWISLIKIHVTGIHDKFQQFLVNSILVVGYGALVLNFFNPILFWVDSSNNYQRGILFWIFPTIGACFIVNGVIVYLIGRARGSVLRFFPVMQFFVPVVIGEIVQVIDSKVTFIWPGIAVGITTMIISLQNENIFRDNLTGLLNRFYLDKLSNELKQQKIFGLMMLDMNNFKQINDAYGHSEGDQALIAMAKILKSAVWIHGTVIRYAGDEFVVLLYADREEIVESFTDQIKRGIDDYNHRSGKEYELSISVGYGVFNLENENMDDVMKIVDKRMYEDKRKYYEENPDQERRHGDNLVKKVV